MSIFTGIANAEHTAVNWLEKEFAKLQKAAPTIETMTEHGASYAVTGLKIVLAQLDPNSAEAKAITVVIQKLLTLSAVAMDFGAHAPTLSEAFGVIVSDLNAILSLGSIKNVNLVGNIGKVVQTIATLVAVFSKIAPVVAAAV